MLAMNCLFNPCKEDLLLSRQWLLSLNFYVAGRDPPNKIVEEVASETQFNVFQDFKVFVLASVTLKRLGLKTNSMRETLLAAQRLLRRQNVDAMRQTTIEDLSAPQYSNSSASASPREMHNYCCHQTLCIYRGFTVSTLY